jgi:xanthine dehydrogenase accessory factor
MWVDRDGAIVGSVTIGGCVDARVIEASTEVLASGRPQLLSLALGDEDAWALGMTCAGTVTVLVEPADPGSPADPVTSGLRAAEHEVAAGRRAVIVVPLDAGSAGGSRLWVPEDGAVSGTLGNPRLDTAAAEAARARLAANQSSGVGEVVDGDVQATCYFEVHTPPLTLVVFGATHVAVPLVELARHLGMRTVVVDGRDRFATRARFPHATELIVGMPSEIASAMPLGSRSIVVLLSHDYKYDLPVLRSVLASEATFIGCLGSRRRGRAMVEFLAEQGVPRAALERVHIPVGLDIGASSPAEIALSVLAQALAVVRGRPGGSLQARPRVPVPSA